MNAQCNAVTAELDQRSTSLNSVKVSLISQLTAVPPAEHAPRTGLIRRTIASYTAYLNARRLRKIDRDAFRHLARLDDSILQDIGVTRADVNWAMQLPLSENASKALQEISRGYKQRA